MKHRTAALLLLAGSAPALCMLAACKRDYDHTKHISEAKRDIFRAETEEFTITLDCVSREYPYLPDGVTSPMTDLVEISLVPAAVQPYDYSVYFEDGRGGEMSFRNTHGDWFFSESTNAFPEKSVSLRVTWENEERTVTATSVKNEHTLTVEQALQHAVAAEKEKIDRMTVDKVFRGEYYVRLLRRDKTYYYVGISDGNSTLSLLLDSETGEILARRENPSRIT